MENSQQSEQGDDRPFFARFAIELAEGSFIDVPGEFTINVNGPRYPDNFSIRFAPLGKPMGDKPKNLIKNWNVILGEFQSEQDAVVWGKRFSRALMWLSVSYAFPVLANYEVTWSRGNQPATYYREPLPFHVYHKHLSQIVYITQHGGSFTPLEKLASHIRWGLELPDEIDERLVVALELFASSHFETTPRARFIGLVSSLEPLLAQKNFKDDDQYGPRVRKVLNSLTDQVNEADGISDEIKKALTDKIKGDLHRESVGKALVRLVGSCLPNDKEALRIMKKAYNMRSKMVHEGTIYSELSDMNYRVGEITRRILASKYGFPNIFNKQG